MSLATKVPLDLDDTFEAFMRQVFPSLPQHSTQYFDCRRVFYVGVSTLFDHITANLGAPDVTEEVGIAEMENIRRQLQQFVAQMKKGNV